MPTIECLEELNALGDAVKVARDEMGALEADHNELMTFKTLLLSEIQKSSPRVKSVKTAERRAKKQMVGDVTLYEKLFSEYMEVTKANHTSLYETWQKKREARDDFLAKQAPTPTLEDTWFLVESVWVSSYRTQGWGAQTYAKASADMRADSCRLGSSGVEVRVRYLVDYLVEARVESSIDAEIVLRRKKFVRLREQVRSCWARGVNPRVFNPWLEPGFEEKNGLDYFGGEVEK